MSFAKTLIIFGAGASYNCFPTVEDMKIHIPLFIKKLDQYRTKNGVETLIQDLEYISKSLDVVPTPDAAIQNIFVHKKHEYLGLLKSYWIYLNILQYANKEEIGLTEKYFNRKFGYYDTRYGEFLLQHFLPNPKKFTILSWNYDINFELSYKYLKGQSQTEDAFLEIPCFPKPKSNQPLEHETRLYHLNGTCSFYEYEGNYQTIHPPNAHLKIELDMPLKSLLNELLWIHNRTESSRVSIRDTLKFAFSYSEKENDRIRSIIRDTCLHARKAVFIGYSFPHTNIEMDNLIFNNLSSSCDIVLQNPKRLKTLVSERFKISLPRITEIFEKEDMNEFAVI